MRLVKSDVCLIVQARWKSLPGSKDTLELIAKVYKDVPQLLFWMLQRRKNLSDLNSKARRTLLLGKRSVTACSIILAGRFSLVTDFVSLITLSFVFA